MAELHAVGSRPRSAWWPAIVAAMAVTIALVAPINRAPAEPTGGAESSVVQIKTTVEYQGVIGNGAGIVLSPDGIVLTNNHVVQGADVVTGSNVGTGQSFRGQLLGYDRTNDVAVIQLVGASGLPAAPIGDSSQVTVGESVVSLGNANGNGNSLSRETGTVSGLNQSISAEDELTGSSEQLTGLIGVAAPLRPGDSGGPLVNGSGQVIGLNVAASVNYRVGSPGGEGFAIPINKAIAIANQIQSRTPSDTVHIGAPAMLGIGVGTAQQRGGGVVVRDVLRGTPAEQIGLARGDVITALDGVTLNNATALTTVLDHHYPGDAVDVTWTDRTGQQRAAKVTLMAGPTGYS